MPDQLSTAREFINFIRTGKTTDIRKPFRELVLLFTVLLVLRYAIVLVKALLMEEDLLEFSEAEERLELSAVFSYILLIPLIEELLFRGFLDLRRKRSVIVFIGLAAIFGLFIYFRSDQFLFLGLFLILFVVYAYLRIDSFRHLVDGLLMRGYHLFVILSVLLFAGMHITNYDDYSVYTFMALIPRVISGFYLAFIVTKYTIWHSWLMHALNNTTPFLLILAVDTFSK
ncbi:MAG: CPBP family glutamic-type intramembrane protease [Cyclobacteriaceae bacterium]